MPPKKVIAVVKIQLDAGSATPAPPVGTALGPHGIQTMEFCKQYNAATEDKAGQVIPVEITIFEDRSFSFVLKTPPTAVLLREERTGTEFRVGLPQTGQFADLRVGESVSFGFDAQRAVCFKIART